MDTAIFSLDSVCFVAFFAAILAVSIFKGRKESSSEDYFLAGRSLTWPLIGLSIVAANISTEQFVGMAGQGAGSVGIAVSNWQLIGSLGIILTAFTLLPKFLRAGIYTMPEYLEYRYSPAARSIMAALTLVIYVGVLITAVLYSGGLTMNTLLDVDLVAAVWMIGIVATAYTAFGGLKAVVWADLFQGGALLLGGLVVFFLALSAVGGWNAFVATNHQSLHMVLPANHPDLPWTGVVSGMWIVLIYYCGLNQFIVQRTLAARSLTHGQLGIIFAAGLWLLIPFAIVMPGIMAAELFPEQLRVKPDAAYPTLIRELVPPGGRGLIVAAIAGAVISSLASLLNSASTIFTMDLYRRLIHPTASQATLVGVGRIATVVCVVIGCLVAPLLARNQSVFQFIQQFQGYIWPGVVATFLVGFAVPRAPGAAGVAGLVAGPFFYGILQFASHQGFFEGLAGEPRLKVHFLIQVLLSFMLTCGTMGIITVMRPLAKPVTLPVREDIPLTTEPVVKVAAAAVIAGVAVFYALFW
jgi:SSS family solute:Na+ symporter